MPISGGKLQGSPCCPCRVGKVTGWQVGGGGGAERGCGAAEMMRQG